MKRPPSRITALLLLLACALHLQATDYKSPKSPKEWPREARSFPAEFYRTTEARRIGDNVLLYQLNSGGWPKNIYIPAELSEEQLQAVKKAKKDVNRGTIDNKATTTEIGFLAQLYEATREKHYRDATLNGLSYLLQAQYENGGWPQFYPDTTEYHAQITFNDQAMIHVLQLLRQAGAMESPYTWLPDSVAQSARKAFNKGIQCILDCQVWQDGKPTVWCAQHDRHNLMPCKGRAYELPSLSGAESADITLLLMSLPHPEPDVVQAIEGSVAWFQKTAITNLKKENFINGNGEKDYRMVQTENAPRLWARFYEVGTNQPFFCGRDGIKKYRVENIEHERRNGYSWFGRSPEKVLNAYNKWKQRLSTKPYSPKTSAP